MLDAFATGIWLAPGSEVQVFGFRYPTRMAVIRLGDGGLLIWSPIALTDALRDAVTALGPVRHLVAPNTLHHLFLPAWVAAFPEARLHGSPGLAAKRPDLRFHDTLGDTPPPDWAGDLDQVILRGNAITTEAVFFHRASATVLVCDTLQQFDDGWFRGWRRIVARLDGMVSPSPAMPRKFRLAFTGKAQAGPAVRRLLDWPARRLIVAHGAPVHDDAAAILARAFGWLAS